MSRLRIAHGNIYVGNDTPNRAIRSLTATGADSIGWNEAYKLIDRLDRVRNYRMHVGQGARDQRRGAYDTPILTRHNLASVLSLAVQASEQVRPTRIAPDRWITASVFEHAFGVIGHVNMHPNAGVTEQPLTVPRVRQFDKSMGILDQLLDFLEPLTDGIVVSGDGNFPEGHKSGARSPYSVFKRHGMDWKAEHLDVMAWTKTTLTLDRWHVIPKTSTGSDHPFIVADFGRTKGKK